MSGGVRSDESAPLTTCSQRVVLRGQELTPRPALTGLGGGSPAQEEPDKGGGWTNFSGGRRGGPDRHGSAEPAGGHPSGDPVSPEAGGPELSCGECQTDPTYQGTKQSGHCHLCGSGQSPRHYGDCTLKWTEDGDGFSSLGKQCRTPTDCPH